MNGSWKILPLALGAFILILSPASPSAEMLVDGFESESNWFVEPPGSQWITDATRVARIGQQATEGDYSLEADIDFSRGIGRAHIKRSFERQPGNWSDYNHAVLDIVVEQPGRIRLGLHGRDRTYEQTESIPLQPGMNRDVAIPIDTISPETRSKFLLLTLEISGYNQSQKCHLDRLRVASFEAEKAASSQQKEGNLASGRALSVSSVDEWSHPARYAVDGSMETRWSSQYTDKQSWILDFGQPVEFNTVILHWEWAFPSRYDLSVSTDRESWTPLFRMENGIGGMEILTTEPQQARYLRWQGQGRGTPYGYSLYEIEVYHWPERAPGFERKGITMNRIQPIVDFHPLENRNPVSPQPPAIRAVTFPRGNTVGKYEKIEWNVDFEASWSNPYDPDDIDVLTILESPSGREYRVPGFYYWPFERRIVQEQEQLAAGSNPLWLVRFTPVEEGTWMGRMQVRNRQGEARSDTFTFQCIASTSPGFIQVAKGNPDYFEFQNGDLYFPVGLNVCWYLGQPNDPNLQTLAYDRWLDRLAENGVNYIRLWMWPMGFCPEWYDTGLGDYDLRQPNLWRLDYVLQKCESLGIYALISLINHGQFSSRVNAEWDSNPFSIENGGMLESPDQFLTHPEARRLFARRLRYLMARYGYSTHVFSWEWFNEVEWTDGLAGKNLIPWMEEMAEIIRKYDPNPHLLTVSSKERGDEMLWNSKTIDFTQVHQYNCRNWAPEIAKQIRFMKEHYGRPAFMGEFGLEREYFSEDPQGIHLRIGNWASLMSGAAGGAMSWWWDQYIDAFDLYEAYRGFSAFVAGETLNRESYRPDESIQVDPPRLEAFALRGPNRLLVWIRRSDYSLAGLRSAPDQLASAENTGAKLRIRAVSNSFQVEWWDTETGEIVDRKDYSSNEEEAEIPVPSFARDIACKIVLE